MTKQEILDYLNQYRNAGNHIHREAMDAAIEAFEKQIPKKPNKAIDHTWGTEKEVPVCPVCDYYITPVQFIDMTICETTGKCEKPKVTYCDVCGQAINWSDDDDEKNT